MKVSKSQTTSQNVTDYSTYAAKQVQKNLNDDRNDSSKEQKINPDWQKNILMQGLDKLENSIQMDNSHPLDNVNAAPIESFEEALIELSFMKTPFFIENAAAAQANISAESIVSLFTSE